MKKLILATICLMAFGLVAAQTTQTVNKKVQLKKVQLNENTVVVDSAGNYYPYESWRQMLSSGEYGIRTKRPVSDSAEFFIYKLSAAEKASRLSRLPKPPESAFFTTGELITPFKANDINGNKLNLKAMAGKVVVLNFWFIDCAPCRQEIPELNKLALSYANNPNVVFIAIALDQRADIQKFIKSNPFGYQIVADGREYADIYKLRSYPTNVVVDKEGKVRFHSSGYSSNTVNWIAKTVKELEGQEM